MKKLIYIISVLVFCNFAKAQTFTVGNTCCNYNLVNYVLPGPCTYTPWPQSSSFAGTYSLDVDGDLLSDLTINSSCHYSGGGSGWTDNYIWLSSTNNTESVFGAITCTCTYSLFIENLSLGSVLSPSLTWGSCTFTFTSGAAPYLYYYYYKPASFPIAMTGGQQTNPFYIGFRKVLASTDTIYGWIRMDSNFPGKVIDYAYTCGTYTGTPPTSTITTPPIAICKGDSVLLNATPAGGMFFGTGVSGNYFKSKNLAAGVYTVNYALPNPNGCSVNPSTITLTVTGAAFTSTQTVLCVGESLTLTATPAGGVFTGTNISGNVFSPIITGTYSATYSYTNSLGCVLTTSNTLTSNACVGITEIDNLNSSINIFPNPAANKVTISVGEYLKDRKVNCEIISVEGKLLKSILITQSETEVDISTISAGIYFVELNFNNNKVRRKLIITR